MGRQRSVSASNTRDDGAGVGGGGTMGEKMSCYFSIMSARASPLTDNRNEGGVSALRLKIKSVFNGYLTGLLRCTSPELQIHLGWLGCGQCFLIITALKLTWPGLLMDRILAWLRRSGLARFKIENTCIHAVS